MLSAASCRAPTHHRFTTTPTEHRNRCPLTSRTPRSSDSGQPARGNYCAPLTWRPDDRDPAAGRGLAAFPAPSPNANDADDWAAIRRESISRRLLWVWLVG